MNWQISFSTTLYIYTKGENITLLKKYFGNSEIKRPGHFKVKLKISD